MRRPNRGLIKSACHGGGKQRGTSIVLELGVSTLSASMVDRFDLGDCLRAGRSSVAARQITVAMTKAVTSR
jgi:hypothetical protein